MGNIKSENITEIIDSLNEKINNNMEELEKATKTLINTKNKRNTIQYYLKDVLKQISLFLIAGTTIVGLIIGSAKLSKEKKYYKTTTTYSKQNGIINTESKYGDSVFIIGPNTLDNLTIIYEETPYEEYRTGFIRTVTTYNVSNITGIPLEEYLDLDLKSLGIEGTSSKYEKTELDLDDLYEKTIRYVEQTTVDKDNYQEKTNITALIIYLILSIPVEMMIEVTLYVTDFNKNNCLALIAAIKEIKEDIILINKEKTNIKIYTKKFEEINSKCEKLLRENKDLIKKLMNYYENIKNNPEYYEETKNIEKTLKLIKEKANN